MASTPDNKDHPEWLNPHAEGLEAADRPSNEAQNTRRRIRRAMLSERANRVQVLRGHVMGLAMLRRWHDERGCTVGMVDYQGNPVRGPIEQGLQRMGRLIHEDDSIVIRESTQKELREACLNVDPALFESFGKVTGPIEEAFSELKTRITNLEGNPNYLFQFKRGEKLREDLTRILSLMEGAKKITVEDFKRNEWFLHHSSVRHLPSYGDLDATMLEAASRQRFASGWERLSTEYQARFELQEKLRIEILMLAGRKIKPIKIAERIPALMVGHLDLLTHGTVTQNRDLFGDQDCELGQTDAESMCHALDLVNRCLLAHADIQRTKQVIPVLA